MRKVTANNIEFAPAPAGSHLARTIWLIELGTHTETYAGMEKTNFKTAFAWELPTELQEFDESKGPQPFIVTREFNMSLGEKANLRKFLEGWRGEVFTKEQVEDGFDPSVLAGKACLVNVIHRVKQKVGGGSYAFVDSASKLPKGMVCPPQINPTIVYSIDDGKNAVYAQLPEWIKKKIAASKEFTSLASSPVQNDAPVDPGIDSPEAGEESGDPF